MQITNTSYINEDIEEDIEESIDPKENVDTAITNLERIVDIVEDLSFRNVLLYLIPSLN